MQKIVVLLSSYNGEKYLSQQIDSILKQRNVELNLIVRDDGSTDNTINILEYYQDNNDNFEFIRGNNCGSTNSFSDLLSHAYGKYGDYCFYSFADQDDVWLPNKLSIAIEHIDLMASVPMLYCSNLQCVDENLNNLELMRSEFLEFSKTSTLIEPIATGCTMVFNPKAAELYISSFNLDVRMHDIWMSQICAFLGSVYYDNNSYILYRQHSSNQIGKPIGLKGFFKSKLHSLYTLRKQHIRELDSKIFLKKHGCSLSKEDFNMVNTVANYRTSFLLRLNFLFGLNGCKLRRAIEPNFFLYIRIILGCV